MKRRSLLLLAILSIVVATGCPERKFKVQMTRTPDGDVQRSLTLWTDGDEGEVGPEEDALAAAQQAYGTEGEAKEKRVCFERVFDGQLPADLTHKGLGNDGLVSKASSSVGAVVMYVERMPGEADPVKLLRAAERVVDTVARALSAGFGHVPELAAEPEQLKRVQHFLETQFKEDCLAAVLLGWQAMVRMDCASEIEDADGTGVSSPERFMAAEMARLVDFAVERGYLDREGLILDEDELQRAIGMGFARRLATEAGYARNEPLPACWKALGQDDGLSDLWERGLAEIGVSEEDFFAMAEALMPGFFGTATAGSVAFGDVDKPLLTNGQYDGEKRTLSWDCHAQEGCIPPQMLFAVWADADEAWQTKHLGRVMCSGERLKDYAVWRAGLEDVQRAEWDAMVETVMPDDAAEKLGAFRFAADEEQRVRCGQKREDVTPGAKLILGM